MQFKEITLKEYKKVSESIYCKNFFQTTMMLDRYKKNNEEYYLVGVEENNEVIAATMLVVHGKTINGKKVFNSYKGPLLDYNNTKLLEYFLKELTKFVKAHNGYLLYIDPYIPNVSRDTDGNITSELDNRKVSKKIKELGYKYIGEYTQVKWNYCLDINGMSKEEIFKTFKPNTRNNINKTLNKYFLDVRKLSYDELSDFKRITEDTCKRRGFKDKELSYYEDMYNTFKDQVVFYICELNIPKYISKMEEDNKINEEKINNLSDSSSNRNKKEAMKQVIDGNLKRIEEAKSIQKEKGDILPLSCAMFILFGDEIVYLFSGSYDEYMEFLGQYRLQWEIIQYACDNNYKRYNFYGIKDLFNPKGKDYGVYEFKKGFSGYVEELLGTFVKPIGLLGHLMNLYYKIKR